MRRRASTPSVTLFPFLAVLVCTMGALIFLLLVTTRRIQLQAQLPVAAIESTPDPASKPGSRGYPVVQSLEHLEELLGPTLPFEETEEIDPFDENEPILPLLAGNTIEENEWLQSQWEAKQAAQRRAFESALAARNQQQEKLKDDWQQKVKILSQELVEKEKVFRQLDAQSKALRDERNRLRKKKESALNRLQEIRNDEEKFGLISKEKTTERTRLLNDAAELTRQIARLEKEFENLPPETEIVAYDSLTGTSKKPILIECRKNEIVFAAEGVVLSAKELSGFPPEYNPLRSGAEALVNYWNKHGQTSEKPYLLLVVRPEGTTGFYVARGLLSKMNHRFGYELIDTETDLKWPETDPGAIHACQEAVFRTLKDRDRVAVKIGRGLTGSKGPLNYSNPSGEFHLPDMNPVNRSRSRNFLGDEKWIPPKRNNLDSRPRMSSSRSPSRAGRLPSKSKLPVKQQPSFNSHHIPFQTPFSSTSSQKILERQPQGRTQSQPQRDTYLAPRQLPSTSAKPIGTGDMPALLPPNPFETQLAGQSGPNSNGKGVRLPQPNRGIGIEREVELHLWPDRVRIGDGIALAIPSETSSADFKSALSSVVRKTASEWEEAPESYFWKPVIKIVIHPGGLLHYAKTKELTDKWGVPSQVEYELQ